MTPIRRIRAPRMDDPRSFNAHQHLVGYRIAYSEPAYPDAAREQAVEGTVVLDLEVDPDGAIESLSLRSGHPLLADAAVAAVRQWRYRPTTLNGKPVAVVTDVEVTFALPDRVVSA